VTVHVFGIRHHGPGSARSLRVVLDALEPDVVLVEGPPDANDVVALAAHPDMRPPVALLLYAPDDPRRAVYYPFAEFSPEWVAVRHALGRGVPVRFIDLPAAHHLAPVTPDTLDAPDTSDTPAADAPAAEAPAAGGGGDGADGGPPDPAADDPAVTTADLLRRDPLSRIAEAAGYADGERWWEHVVEERSDHTGVFDAVLEVMRALREAYPEADDPAEALRERQREAWMRQAIRAAEREGFARAAVVCGAWHAPALATRGPVKPDAALLKGLPKCKVQATWIPWTSTRLARESGYGAGVESPGWYGHLWTHGAGGAAAIAWVTRVARLLREEGIDASSAQVIDAVRLATTLATLRERSVPGLSELTDATLAAFLGGDGTALALIRDRLVVGDELGVVPEGAPSVPLQASLAADQKRLRLAPEAGQRVVELDLRQPHDLEKSVLLHRLNLLDIDWGHGERAAGKGTFKEVWRLQWRPELSLAVIEAAPWGNSVADAAAARAAHLVARADDLPALSTLLGRLLVADLPGATRDAVVRLDTLAAMSGDLAQLCDALPPLARTLRYGDVRGTDQALVARVVAGLTARIAAGLPAACGALDDAAAEAMHGRIVAVAEALGRLQDDELRALWHDALRRVLALPNAHGLVTGRCGRLLLDAGVIAAADAGRLWAAALSPGAEPTAAAAWVDGFLRGSGTLLVHDATLFPLLDAWLTDLSADVFIAVLPLLRRTVSTFSAPERRRLGERAAHGDGRARGSAHADQSDFDAARAAAVLPTIARLLGIEQGSRV
jgi:hypothetical protein